MLAPLVFCSDNALMIARAGCEKYLKKEFISHDKLTINPRASFKKFEIFWQSERKFKFTQKA